MVVYIKVSLYAPPEGRFKSPSMHHYKAGLSLPVCTYRRQV